MTQLRYHKRLLNTTNHNKILVIMTHPSSVNGNDGTTIFIKNYIDGIIDLVNIIPYVGKNLQEIEVNTTFSLTELENNRDKIKHLLDNNIYNKIYVAVGQDFLLRNNKQIYINECKLIVEMLMPYSDKVYCFGITSKKMHL